MSTTNDTVETVGVCHPNWRGIKAATQALVPKVFEVSEVNSYSEAQGIAAEIISDQPQKIVLSGYPRGYGFLAKALKEQDPKLRIFFLSHASFTWYTDRDAEVSWLQDMFEAYDSGFIEKIGFVKRDPFIYFRERGVNAFFVMNRPPDFNGLHHVLPKDNLHLGVWGSNMWHRNLLNQVIGGLMVENSRVHVNEIPKYFFWDDTRITRHGILPREEYISVLCSMDINLYISFTDCFPMTVIESMSYGIPCVTSDTSEVYSWSSYLKKNLIIGKIDSPVAIREKILWIRDNYEDIQREMSVYLPVLKKEIEKSIQDFLK